MPSRSEPMIGFSVTGVDFQATPETSALLQSGALDPDVAYMQGRLKVAGNMAAFYDLLPLAGSAAFREALGA